MQPTSVHEPLHRGACIADQHPVATFPTPDRIIPANSITTDATPAAVLTMPTTTAARGRATKEALPSAMAVNPTPAIASATIASTLDATNNSAATAIN